MKRLLGRHGLHTVCEGAKCPNRAACWHDSAAAFLILGDACTRACRFCAIPHAARPAPPDHEVRASLELAMTTSTNWKRFGPPLGVASLVLLASLR